MFLNSARLNLLQRSNFLATLAYRQNAITSSRFLASSQHNHLHFHQKTNAKFNEKVKTGLVLNRQNVNVKSISYLQSNSFHSHNILYVNNSNFAGQKVSKGSDVKNTKNVDKEEEMKDVDIQTENVQQKIKDEKPLTLVAKFKKMAKEYWYVLIPVHAVTSVGWIGGFYYASLNGVDIVGIMESFHFSEAIIGKLRDSTLGHWAIAYLLYKIASPARYAVTLGGTTYAINILSSRGIIKPLPSRNELVQMYKDKKDDIQQKIEDKKLDIQQKLEETKLKMEETKEKVSDKREELIQKFEDTKQDIQQKLEETKQDLQHRVTEKKQELGDKIKGRD